MARGVRKTPLEKLHEELAEVQDAIAQYGSSLTTMKEKEKHIKQQIEIEELKSIRGLMEENGVTINDLKDMILSSTTIDQGA